MNEKISSKVRLWSTRFLTMALFSLVMIPAAIVFSLNWFNPPVSSFMLGNKLSNPQKTITYDWKDWNEIAVSMPLAVIASEHEIFSKKYSFDFSRLTHILNFSQENPSSTKSNTITNQTVRNLFLWEDQNEFSQGLETWLTFLMETTVDKQRILEIYLNIIEFSPDVYGIEGASQKFFFKPADKLSAKESASIAAILPEPKQHQIDSPTAIIEQRQREIMDQMQILDQAMLLGLTNNRQKATQASLF